MQYNSYKLYYLDVMSNINFKNRSNVKVKRFCTNIKGLIIRNTFVKYQSSSTHCSKVISMVKLQGEGHRVKNNGPTERSCHKEYLIEIPVSKL